MSPETLTNRGAIQALSRVGQRFVNNVKLDPDTSVVFVTGLIGPSNIPDWASQPLMHEREAGPVAKAVLADMLKTEGRLRDLAGNAIDEEGRTEGHIVVESVLAGLFVLALVSKVSYTKEDGIKIAPGFPGFADALDSAAKLLGTIPGFTPPAAKDAKG